MPSLSLKRILIMVSILVIGIIALLIYWIPAPPKKITLATGSESGLYYALGERFKKELAKEGVEVIVKQTAGSIENLQLLNDPKSGVTMAFVQGGIGSSKEYPQLNSIAGMYYEPLWIVYRPEAFKNEKGVLERLNQLEGRRISIGNPGSGTLKLAQELLKLNQLDPEAPQFQKLTNDVALEKLRKGELDVMVVVAAAEAKLMQTIFQEDKFKLVDLKQAKAYPPRLPYLKDIVVERGVLNIVDDVPPKPIQLLAPTAELVAKENVHPAIVSLMLKTSYDLLKSNTLLQAHKEFPSANHLSFDLNEDAENYMQNGPSFLHRHLPFWVAVWIDRLVRILIPLIAILFPIFNLVPKIYEYRIKLRFATIYVELRNLEKDATQMGQKTNLLNRFTQIEDKVMHMKVPKMYQKDLYDLRMHVIEIKSQMFNSVKPV